MNVLLVAGPAQIALNRRERVDRVNLNGTPLSGVERVAEEVLVSCLSYLRCSRRP